MNDLRELITAMLTLPVLIQLVPLHVHVMTYVSLEIGHTVNVTKKKIRCSIAL